MEEYRLTTTSGRGNLIHAEINKDALIQAVDLVHEHYLPRQQLKDGSLENFFLRKQGDGDEIEVCPECN